MDAEHSGAPKAEELIAEIYGLIAKKREAASLWPLSSDSSSTTAPSRIVMSMEHYRIVQSYRARLGETPDPDLDYLGKYELFGLPVFIDDQIDPRVE